MTSETNTHATIKKNSSDKVEESKVDTFRPIGPYLKDLRESKNISLSQISEKTRIHLSLLKELEKNQIDALPNKTYVRGFIKSYAKYIGTDVEKALDCLEETYRRFAPSLSSDAVEERKEIDGSSEGEVKLSQWGNIAQADSAQGNKILTFPVLLTIFFVMLITLPILYFYKKFQNNPSFVSKNTPIEVKKIEKIKMKKMDKINEMPSVPKETVTKENMIQMGPLSNIYNPHLSYGGIPSLFAWDMQGAVSLLQPQSSKEVQGTETEVVGKSLNQNESPESDIPKLILEEGTAKNTVIIEERGDDKETVQVEKITRPMYRSVAEAPEARDPLVFPSEFKNAMNPQKENVFIHALEGDSWITYKKDNSSIKSFILKQDEHLFLQGEEIRILLGNVNATKIFYNNRLLDIPSKTGVKSIVFPPPSEKKQYYLPLFIHHKDGRIFTIEEYLNSQNIKE